MSTAQFHPIAPLDKATKEKEGFVMLVGNGTPMLECPRLKKLKRVFIGDVELPLKLTETYLIGGGKTEDVTLDMVRVEQPEKNGSPILLRNIKSNNGIWQEGQAIFIDGDFAAA